MRVHHLDCGTMCPFPARLVGGQGGLFERARMCCHCLLLESAAGLVLVETGIGLQDIADPLKRLGRRFLLRVSPPLDPEQTAARQVERLGFARKDVRHIVLTHAHNDHAGGIASACSARTTPRSSTPFSHPTLRRPPKQPVGRSAHRRTRHRDERLE